MPKVKDDIVLVPFPFSDQTAVKKRPAVIISSSQYNTTSQDIIIMAVTSRIDRLLFGTSSLELG